MAPKAPDWKKLAERCSSRQTTLREASYGRFRPLNPLQIRHTMNLLKS
ncbi:MAG: hypothetical protein HRU34_24815 [Richelia sp.]|nr:hypothetical protein [Richelia sp.]